MASVNTLVSRDSSDSYYNDGWYGPGMHTTMMVLFGLVLAGSILSLALVCLRRKRLARQPQHTLLPSYNVHAHHRSVSVTNIPTMRRNDTSVFVYDEKMNLIANSSSPPSASIPQIRVTFPDDDDNNGQAKGGRVVVVHVTDTGSVGMSPLQQDPLPPYQQTDVERFQSLDLDRMGGLREKETPQQRYS